MKKIKFYYYKVGRVREKGKILLRNIHEKKSEIVVNAL
jgi:hypothetical protein